MKPQAFYNLHLSILKFNYSTPAHYEVIQGNDNQTVLRIMFATLKEGEVFVEALHRSHGISSVTNSGQPKSAQQRVSSSASYVYLTQAEVEKLLPQLNVKQDSFNAGDQFDPNIFQVPTPSLPARISSNGDDVTQHQAVLDLISNHKAVAKMFSANWQMKSDEKNIIFLLEQLLDPTSKRPSRRVHRNSDYGTYASEGINVPTINKVNPLDKKVQQVNKAPKNAKQRKTQYPYTKKSACTILPVEPKYIKTFGINFVLGYLWAQNRCYLVDEKYTFLENACTDTCFWLNTSSVSTHAAGIAKIKEKNNAMVAKGREYEWNECLFGFPQGAPDAIIIRKDENGWRINALRIMYQTRDFLGVKYDLPVIIMPLAASHRPYLLDERRNDVQQALALPNSIAYKMLKENNDELLNKIVESEKNLVQAQSLVKASEPVSGKTYGQSDFINWIQSASIKKVRKALQKLMDDPAFKFSCAEHNSAIINYFIDLPIVEGKAAKRLVSFIRLAPVCTPSINIDRLVCYIKNNSLDQVVWFDFLKKNYFTLDAESAKTNDSLLHFLVRNKLNPIIQTWFGLLKGIPEMNALNKDFATPLALAIENLNLSDKDSLETLDILKKSLLISNIQFHDKYKFTQSSLISAINELLASWKRNRQSLFSEILEALINKLLLKLTQIEEFVVHPLDFAYETKAPELAGKLIKLGYRLQDMSKFYEEPWVNDLINKLFLYVDKNSIFKSNQKYSKATVEKFVKKFQKVILKSVRDSTVVSGVLIPYLNMRLWHEKSVTLNTLNIIDLGLNIGDVQLVKKVIKITKRIYDPSPDMNIVLQIALPIGNVNTIVYIINQIESPFVLPPELVKDFIINYSKQSLLHQDPLIVAAEQGDLSVFNWLLLQGCKVTKELLISLSKSGWKDEMIKKVISKNHISQLSSDDFVEVLVAFFKNKFSYLKELLLAGNPANKISFQDITNKYKTHILYVIADQGESTLLELALKFSTDPGADLNQEHSSAGQSVFEKLNAKLKWEEFSSLYLQKYVSVFSNKFHNKLLKKCLKMNDKANADLIMAVPGLAIQVFDDTGSILHAICNDDKKFFEIDKIIALPGFAVAADSTYVVGSRPIDCLLENLDITEDKLPLLEALARCAPDYKKIPAVEYLLKSEATLFYDLGIKLVLESKSMLLTFALNSSLDSVELTEMALHLGKSKKVSIPEIIDIFDLLFKRNCVERRLFIMKFILGCIKGSVTCPEIMAVIQDMQANKDKLDFLYTTQASTQAVIGRMLFFSTPEDSGSVAEIIKYAKNRILVLGNGHYDEDTLKFLGSQRNKLAMRATKSMEIVGLFANDSKKALETLTAEIEGNTQTLQKFGLGHGW